MKENDDLGRKVVPSRVYTLAAVEAAFGLSREALIAAGSTCDVALCVLVPVSHYAASLDIRSTVVRDAASLQYKMAMKPVPSASHVPLRADDATLALVVPPNLCEVVCLTGTCRADVFRQAVRINVRRLNPMPVIPELLEPACLPLVDVDGRMLNQRDYCRFGVYKVGSPITYDQGTGFAGPEEVLISPDTLCIVGIELLRLLGRTYQSAKGGQGERNGAAEATAERADVLVPNVNGTVTESERVTRPSQDEPKNQPVDAEVIEPATHWSWEPSEGNSAIIRELYRLIQKYWQPAASKGLKTRAAEVREKLETELKSFLIDLDVKAPAETAKALAALIQPEATRKRPLLEPLHPPYVSKEYRILLRADLQLSTLVEMGGQAFSRQAEREALVRRLLIESAAPLEPLTEYKVRAVVHILCRK